MKKRHRQVLTLGLRVISAIRITHTSVAAPGAELDGFAIFAGSLDDRRGCKGGDI